MNFFDETALTISEPPDVLGEIEHILPRDNNDGDEDDDEDEDDDDTEDDSGIADDLTPIMKKFPELANFDSIGDEGTNINNFLNYW